MTTHSRRGGGSRWATCRGCISLLSSPECRQDAVCFATALRYRLHASPNPYVSTRAALSVFRLVSLSKLSRSAKREQTRDTRVNDGATLSRVTIAESKSRVRKLISIRRISVQYSRDEDGALSSRVLRDS